MGKELAMILRWQPIETCPLAKEVLFWWRPVDDNVHAESVVIGSLPGRMSMQDKWWNSHTGTYQDIWHVTHWMEKPGRPVGRES